MKTTKKELLDFVRRINHLFNTVTEGYGGEYVIQPWTTKEFNNIEQLSEDILKKEGIEKLTDETCDY